MITALVYNLHTGLTNAKILFRLPLDSQPQISYYVLLAACMQCTHLLEIPLAPLTAFAPNTKADWHSG